MIPETRRAQSELVERLRPFVARRVPSADVDDVLQDVLLRIQASLGTLRDDERFAPWIFSVARSAVAEHYRQRTRHPLRESAKGEPMVSDTEAAEPSALEKELASYLLQYVARLPSPYREAITLTELEGLTQSAAADALGISLSGMKSRVQRGREKLRVLLDECCRIALDARGRVIECEPRDPSDCRCRNT